MDSIIISLFVIRYSLFVVRYSFSTFQKRTKRTLSILPLIVT